MKTKLTNLVFVYLLKFSLFFSFFCHSSFLLLRSLFLALLSLLLLLIRCSLKAPLVLCHNISGVLQTKMRPQALTRVWQCCYTLTWSLVTFPPSTRKWKATNIENTLYDLLTTLPLPPGYPKACELLPFFWVLRLDSPRLHLTRLLYFPPAFGEIDTPVMIQTNIHNRTYCVHLFSHGYFCVLIWGCRKWWSIRRLRK